MRIAGGTAKRITKRIINFILVIWGVVTLSFCLQVFTGTDPAEMIVRKVNVFATEEQIQAVREELGLDAPFLERYTGKHYPAGDFLDESGRVVGKHRGAVCYTLGQRKGLGLAMGAPVYVCGKDMEKNTVTVGPNEALFSSALRGNNWVWYPFPELTEPVRVTVKTRHSQTEQPGTIYPEADGFARVEFDIPQRAVTPGQAVVVYQGDLVVGGGTITEAIR